jgi:hypothetical protein
VIVWQDEGWLAHSCTDPKMRVVAILEATADRGAIEESFQEVKESWGAGQQQVRTVYASIGAFSANLVLYSVAEVWAWAREEEALVARSHSPWDQ